MAVVSLQVGPGIIDVMLEMCSALEFSHQLFGVCLRIFKIYEFTESFSQCFFAVLNGRQSALKTFFHDH